MDDQRIKQKLSWRIDERDVSVKSHLFGLPRGALFFVSEVPLYQNLMVVVAIRFREKREQLKRLKGILPERQGLDCLACAIEEIDGPETSMISHLYLR